ncbi:hypothetical protein [Paenarthrobacter sp. NCHU4564]|uniref:hypothetical protein n=1 Tax=Paenarthrobacter sp. NCHU4564 TaxID=3451353 RepID=UPI003F9C0D1E
MTNHVVAQINVRSKLDMDRALDEVVASAVVQAEASGRHGVLITRHSFTELTVALSSSVPFRTIHENDRVRAYA